LQPLIKIISESKNVILVRNTLQFINTLVTHRISLMNELFDST